MKITDLPTPCLLVDRTKVANNIASLKRKMHQHRVRLRPHMKTCKSADIARMLVDEANPGITVSTVKEAEYFADYGFTDCMYAVGIVPHKLERIAGLYAQGIRVQLVLDMADTARAVAEQARALGTIFDVFIEIDTDGHRAGIEPGDPGLPEIGCILQEAPSINFLGVMTHAGDSYNCRSIREIEQHADQERDSCILAADRLRAAGIDCPEVSIGSTPTAMCARNLEGVTEVRAGVFVFFDLFQAGLGVCQISDIALSVLTTIISHKQSHNRLIIDAGGLALSKDRGTASQAVDQGFGLVADAETGSLIPGLQVSAANQEHGIIELANRDELTRYPVGSRLRILPNHACMTAAAHQHYFVVEQTGGVINQWERCNGW